MPLDFIPPDFVEDNSPEQIQERMMNQLPEDIDHMPGGIPYDFTMPSAMEKSELIQFHLCRTLMLMFPQYAWGEWLDLHGRKAGVVRREAGRASGEVIFTGQEGAIIHKGFAVCTPATDSVRSIEFETDADAVVGIDGTASVSVTALEPGKASNVPANSVVLMVKPKETLTSVCNKEPITGGSDEEDDTAYYERIDEANASKGTTNVGNESDYIRWAKEVVGVGSVIVVPEWEGPGTGTVKLIIMDSDGMAANQKILDAVYEYIVSPSDPLKRKRPIGASVTVAAPTALPVAYGGKIKLSEGADKEYIKHTFEEELKLYYEQAKKNGELKYTKAAAIMSNIEGLDDFDYASFTINGKQDNILIAEDEYPVTQEIRLEYEEGKFL